MAFRGKDEPEAQTETRILYDENRENMRLAVGVSGEFVKKGCTIHLAFKDKEVGEAIYGRGL